MPFASSCVMLLSFCPRALLVARSWSMMAAVWSVICPGVSSSPMMNLTISSTIVSCSCSVSVLKFVRLLSSALSLAIIIECGCAAIFCRSCSSSCSSCVISWSFMASSSLMRLSMRSCSFIRKVMICLILLATNFRLLS